MINYTRFLGWKRAHLFILSFICIGLALGCAGAADTRILLNGESLHWKGQLDTNVFNNREESGQYTFYYKNEDWQDVEKYTININDKTRVLKEDRLPQRTVHVSISHREGVVTTEESQSVIIQWRDRNGNPFEETILLEG